MRPGSSLVAVVALGACTFEHGALPDQKDAPIADVARMPDAHPADARVCPPPPNATCKLFTCAGSSSCYYECGTTGTSKQNWAGGKMSCANANLGCIATINDQAEQDCITAKTLPTFQSLVWFGWRQDAGATEPAGGWNWECGPSIYVQPAWGLSEPNNLGGNEDCGALTDNGGWIDADCTGTSRFLCELP